MGNTKAEPDQKQQSILEALIRQLSDQNETVDPKRNIVPQLRVLDPEILNNQSIELLVKTAYRRDPDILLDLASGLLRAPLDALRHYVDVIEMLDPDWLALHRELLEQKLFGPNKISDWR